MSTTTEHWSDALVRLDACDEAVSWSKEQPDFATAWSTCDRGDWMLWLAHQLSAPESDLRKRVVFASCQCARLSLKLVPEGEMRPLRAIEAAEGWVAGTVELSAVRKAAAYAADAAAYAAYAASAASAAAYAADAAAYAADAAAYAADAAAYAASAAAYAADAAVYAADAAAYAADAAARKETLAKCAGLARQRIPFDMLALQ